MTLSTFCLQIIIIKYPLIILALALAILFCPSLNAQTCDCNEYIYLNEPHSGGSVHKYLINADGSLTEIGSPWYDNYALGEDITLPHGVGMDINGFLYIGETAASGQIRRLDCDGTLYPES